LPINDLVAQLILGLDYIHKMGIVYEHLKPEEILLDDRGKK
jgi:serine/threonine protein kinase